MKIYNSDKNAVFSPLTEDCQSDVLVIGGGAAGLLCAYYLRKTGLSVCVAEKSLVASGKTAFNSGLLFVSGMPSYSELYRKYGEKAPLLFSDYAEAFDNMAEIAKTVGDASYTKTKALFYTEDGGSRAADMMRREYRQRYFSGEKCAFLTARDAMKLYSFDIACGVLTDTAAEHNPVAFCEKLADYLSVNGADIHENTEITGVSRDCGDRRFRSVSAGGAAVISSAVIDCRGETEGRPGGERRNSVSRSVFCIIAEPAKKIPGWYCESIITDACRMPMYLRTDERGRVIICLRSSSVFRHIGAVHDEYMYRYAEELLFSMFPCAGRLKAAECCRYDFRLPKTEFCGAAEDESLNGFFYISGNNITGLQDSERMARGVSSAVSLYMDKT